MFKAIVLVSAAVGLANAQDTTAIVTDASQTESGLLAYTTITSACLPVIDPNNEPIFSIQTDTVVESCTYVVNADNYSQVVSTIGSIPTADAPATTTSDEVPVSTLSGTNTAFTSGPSATTSTTISTESSAAMTSETSVSGTTATQTATETSAGASDEPTATTEPVETSTGGAVAGFSMGGELFGVVGFMAMLAAL